MTISKQDVFFFEAFEEEAESLKKFLPSHISAGFSWKTIQEYESNEPPAKLISTRTQSIIPLEWANRLDGILSRSTGYNHLHEYLAATNRSIPCGYLPLYCNRAVAEQALLLWMALLRKLPEQVNQFKTFSRDGLTGLECEKKILLVVGVGNIGYQIVKIGRGLGMDVLGVDILKKHDDVNYVDLISGIQQADIIVAAMNLTRVNRGYFDFQLMKKAKSSAIFINIARGELSPAVDLLKLIEEGRLGGLALDVYDDESEIASSLRAGRKSVKNSVRYIRELEKFPNVIFTPHNAFNSQEAVVRKSEQSIRQVEEFIQSKSFVWPIPEE